MAKDDEPPTGPIADLAATLNPAGGALADSLPFALTSETLHPQRMEQGELFDDEDGES